MSISVSDRGFAVTAIQAFPYPYRSPISDQAIISDVVGGLSRIGGVGSSTRTKPRQLQRDG